MPIAATLNEVKYSEIGSTGRYRSAMTTDIDIDWYFTAPMGGDPTTPVYMYMTIMNTTANSINLEDYGATIWVTYVRATAGYYGIK